MTTLATSIDRALLTPLGCRGGMDTVAALATRAHDRCWVGAKSPRVASPLVTPKPLMNQASFHSSRRSHVRSRYSGILVSSIGGEVARRVSIIIMVRVERVDSPLFLQALNRDHHQIAGGVPGSTSQRSRSPPD
jgi:hypothetical protein